MKKLFIILAAVVVLAGCESNGVSRTDNSAIKYIAENSYDFCGETPNEVQKELTAHEWMLNNIYQPDAGHYYAVYIYNRTATAWKPFYFGEYADKGQTRHTEELIALLKEGRVYGELLVTGYYGIVTNINVQWAINETIIDKYDFYDTYSTRLYNEYREEGGGQTAWRGTMKYAGASFALDYDNRNAFIADLRKYTDPVYHEYGQSSNYLFFEVMGYQDTENRYTVYSDIHKED